MGRWDREGLEGRKISLLLICSSNNCSGASTIRGSMSQTTIEDAKQSHKYFVSKRSKANKDNKHAAYRSALQETLKLAL